LKDHDLNIFPGLQDERFCRKKVFTHLESNIRVNLIVRDARQVNVKVLPLFNTALQGDLAIEGIHYAMDCSQAETRAFSLLLVVKNGSKIRCRSPHQYRTPCHAPRALQRTGIKPGIAAVKCPSRVKGYKSTLKTPPLGFHGMEGVHTEIHDDLMDLRGIAANLA